MISISTNIYTNIEDWIHFPKLLAVESFGIEIFPLWHLGGFEEILEKYEEQLLTRNISFHGPYYHCEPSLSEDSFEYEAMLTMQMKTIEWAKRLNATGIIFHHNNCKIDSHKENMKTNAESLFERLYQIEMPQVIENAGVISKQNMLYNQEEFINFCQEKKTPVLIDIGHAFANGWDIEQLVSSLQDQIVAYHLHNNDGFHDSHHRILDGKYPMKKFTKLYQKYTPNATITLEYAKEINVSVIELKEDEKWLLDNLNIR